MKTFAFIFFPQNIKQLGCFLPWTKIMPSFFLKSRLKNVSPIRIVRIPIIRSTQNKVIQGYFILCPLIPQSEAELNEAAVSERLTAALDIAKELEVDILGLDINLSGMAKNTNILGARFALPLVSGYIMTAWSIFETVYRIARVKNMPLKDAVLLVMGEIGPIGALCVNRLSAFASKIIFEVTLKDKPEFTPAINKADIVINLNGAEDFLPGMIKEFKAGAVICDICFNKDTINKLNSLRKDIAIIRSGLIKLPFPVRMGVNLGLPEGIVPAPVAETMLMAFADKTPGCFLSEDENPDKLEELADIAVQHGFQVWVPEAPVL